jgi:hypothetical protein
MGFKRDREKERLKKHKSDKKFAKTRKAIGALTTELIKSETSSDVAVGVAQALSISHLRRIVNNPAKFSAWPDLCRASVDIFAEKTLQLERER